MIRIDEIWLSTQPMDMRAGMDTAMAQVLRAFGYIKPHCAYLFCNKRGHRMKVLVHDGLGIWPVESVTELLLLIQGLTQ
ncbi:putative transposase [Acinetobacter baumannii 15827]|uniref:IS66 family insertion sequence element accessory protein TnpB n=1 Tax=Acinetobacter baumannii TaxID=470 RepID=UPI0004620388|nr:putative transposase [Acinetobacter baumannii 15827]KCX89011.1 putative transposase [Acinetobacter baumannii 15827]